MTQASNDKDAGDEIVPPTPDANGQAAILLVESLIHGLIDRSVISPLDAVEIVDRAVEVQAEVEDVNRQAPPLNRSAYAVLEAISVSLKCDIPRG